MAGTKTQVEGLQSFRASTILSSASTPQNSLEGINPLMLTDGAMCYVDASGSVYGWFPASTLTPDNVNVIRPATISGANPGRWQYVTGGGVEASLLWQNVAPIAVTIGAPNTAVEVTTGSRVAQYTGPFDFPQIFSFRWLGLASTTSLAFTLTMNLTGTAAHRIGAAIGNAGSPVDNGSYVTLDSTGNGSLALSGTLAAPTDRQFSLSLVNKTAGANATITTYKLVASILPGTKTIVVT